jgi:peptidyl-prolyl isomerase D
MQKHGFHSHQCALRTTLALCVVLQGVYFYRIIDQFINQAGVGTDSTYGGYFKDDPGGLAIEHDRAGLLSMAQTGPDTNDSHFSIMMNPAPHLNGKHVVFGELVSGWDVAQAINALSAGQPDNTAMHQPWAQITDSGQLQRVRRH